MSASGKLAALRSRQLTVLVEGNIASGKTAFLNKFNKKHGIQVVPEPVDKWCNVQGHNTLGLMYNDSKRWSLTFQTYVQLTMLDAHTKFDPSLPLKIMERSLFSAKYCFVENLYRSGVMPPVEYAVLSEWFNWINAKISLPVNLIIYLRTSPEIVLNRIASRSRTEESNIPLDYLQSLHKLHEEWLIDRQFHVPAPVLVLDADKDLEGMQDEYDRASKNLDDLFDAHQNVPSASYHAAPILNN